MPTVVDYTTVRTLVCGSGSPRRFALLNLQATLRTGETVLLPTGLYLSLLRTFQNDLNQYAAINSLATLRQDIELAAVNSQLVDDAELIHAGNGSLDILNCLAAAVAIENDCPLAVMKPNNYALIPKLKLSEWWRKPRVLPIVLCSSAAF